MILGMGVASVGELQSEASPRPKCDYLSEEQKRKKKK
jgi:hypothetical protein